jgi:hypothetical protein
LSFGIRQNRAHAATGAQTPTITPPLAENRELIAHRFIEFIDNAPSREKECLMPPSRSPAPRLAASLPRHARSQTRRGGMPRFPATPRLPCCLRASWLLEHYQIQARILDHLDHLDHVPLAQPVSRFYKTFASFLDHLPDHLDHLPLARCTGLFYTGPSPTPLANHEECYYQTCASPPHCPRAAIVVSPARALPSRPSPGPRPVSARSPSALATPHAARRLPAAADPQTADRTAARLPSQTRQPSARLTAQFWPPGRSCLPARFWLTAESRRVAVAT